MKPGDPVRITHAGRTVDAAVLIVTKHDTPGAVVFEAFVGGYLGMMPIMTRESGKLVDLIKQEEVTVELVQNGDTDQPSEKLTFAECDHIGIDETCPDCKMGRLLEGSRALQINVNVKCDNPNCRHEFCIVVWHGMVVGGTRINRDQPDLYGKKIKIK